MRFGNWSLNIFSLACELGRLHFLFYCYVNRLLLVLEVVFRKPEGSAPQISRIRNIRPECIVGRTMLASALLFPPNGGCSTMAQTPQRRIMGLFNKTIPGLHTTFTHSSSSSQLQASSFFPPLISTTWCWRILLYLCLLSLCTSA